MSYGRFFLFLEGEVAAAVTSRWINISFPVSTEANAKVAAAVGSRTDTLALCVYVNDCVGIGMSVKGGISSRVASLPESFSLVLSSSLLTSLLTLLR